MQCHSHSSRLAHFVSIVRSVCVIGLLTISSMAIAQEPPPQFSKTFSPDTIDPGTTSTLTFEIDNTGAAIDATTGDFTDNLPAGLVVETPPNASTTCTAGTLTAVAGGGIITYTGFTVPAGTTCTVSVDVTSNESGVTHANTTGDLTTSLGNSGPATATLMMSEPPRRATFTVTKDFDDDNTSGVDIVIECTTGVPMTGDATVYEFHDLFDEIEFVVQDYDPGELDCAITEDVPEGYEPLYCPGGDAACNTTGCTYAEVDWDESFHCEITNELQEVEVLVDKIWIDDQVAENSEFLYAGARWHCEPVADLDNDVFEPFKGHLSFFGTLHGYREAGDPARLWDFDTFSFYPHYEGSTCTVTEQELDSNVLSDDSDCDDFDIFPGYGLDGEPECVIINTRIYAGIPTLSEFGLALLALLMMTVGFVAYRRFA